MNLQTIKNEILSGRAIDKNAALWLASNSNLNELLLAADEIRARVCGDKFNLCTIINVKSGKCSEDCKYCAQSAAHATGCEVYGVLPATRVLEKALANEAGGAHRFSLVASGRGLKSVSADMTRVEEIYRALASRTHLHLCASFGIADREALERLKAVGVRTFHHNLETSRRFYPQICTTHSYEERINTIKTAQEVGLDVCSGGIFGLGESMEDRVDMAFELSNLHIKSVPINLLTPIPGTPLEDAAPLSREEILRSMAIYRFILPRAYLRFAGGRKNLGDDTVTALKGGINSALTGDFLTTAGDGIEADKTLVASCGYDISKGND